LINGPIKEDNKISTDLLSHSIQTSHKQHDYANNRPKLNKQQLTTMGTNSPITTDIIETVKHASIVINLDELNNFKEYDTVKLIINNKTEEYPMEEFIKKILYLTESETTAAEIQNTNKNTQYKEDMFITNMIDKSKKKNCTIGVDFGLELPPKEVYNTIKTIYSDELAHDFVTALANRLNYEQLKESVGNGLTLYYEGNMPNRNQ
jgi:Fe2+ transport system protein B